jgi:FkbM family methyltransferase
MSTPVADGGGPLRWRAAGVLAARLPNARGRDRVVGLVQGSGWYEGPVRGRLHNGLGFAFPEVRDGSVRSLLALRYRPPVLAPVLRAVLSPGDCFYDVGANLGTYSLWASPLVDESGQVHAFEPVPETRGRLEALITQNALRNVTIVPAAVGAEAGVGYLRTVPGASGLAHLSTQVSEQVAEQSGVSERSGCIEAPLVSLDDYARQNPPPSLVKIDVEGHELGVLRGARSLLDTHLPAVVFETIPSHQARADSPATRSST